MSTIAPHGLHHVTAIASDPQRNVDFYTEVLGLRLVKTTVNFDDPGTFHLYYGDEAGHPSTILTFFPWRGVPRGRQGSGLTTATAFGSLWFSSHPGTASMGKLLALSLATTLLAAVLFQPALMGKPRETDASSAGDEASHV